MKRPLVPVALLFAAGVAAGNEWSAPLAVLLAIGFLLALIAAAWSSARPVLAGAVCFLAGWAGITACTIPLSPVDLRMVVGAMPQIASIRGRFLESPSLRQTERHGQLAERTVVRLEVHELRLDDRWQPAHGKVALTIGGALGPKFHREQRVEVEGVLKAPPLPVAENLFNYREYLRHQGIHHQLVVESTNDVHLGVEALAIPPVSERFLPWARQVLARGLTEDDEAVRLTWAMVLGWKTALTDEVDEPFMRSGTMHVFAISGLHIALIAGLVVQVLRLLRLQRAWCGGLAIPLIWFYVGATGWQSSAIRSAVMMTIVVGGWALVRPGDLLNSLAAAALVVLVWDPAQLFQASFQLSFGVVLSLALLLPPLEAVWLRLAQFDPLLPDDLRPRWQQLLATPMHWLGKSLATTVAAWIGSLPLTWHYFHLVNPISLAANLVIVPLSSLSLAASVASLMCGDWLPEPGIVFNHSAWLWMTAMVRLSRWFSDLPGGCWHAASPSPFWFVPYYLLLIAMSSGWGFAPVRRWWVATSTALWLGAAAIVATVAELRPKLTVLPSTDGAFYDAPGAARDLLVDCGTESDTRFILTPFLHAQGIDRLTSFAASHSDTRHLGGGPELLDRFRPDWIGLPETRLRSPVAKQVVDLAARAGLPIRHPSRRESIGEWRVLNPGGGVEPTAQGREDTLVLVGNIKGVRVLLCSDLDRHGQRTLLSHEDELRADVVIASVPRDGEPLIDPLLAAIRPRLVIITDGEFPATQRIKPALRERLARGIGQTLYTSEVGAVTLTWSHRGCRVLSAIGGEPFWLGPPTAP